MNMLNLKNFEVIDYLKSQTFSFKAYVDAFKENHGLSRIIQSSDLLQDLLNFKLIKSKHIEYILNTITNNYELRSLTQQYDMGIKQDRFLLKYILDDFLLTNELIDKWSACMKTDFLYYHIDFKNFFEYLKFFETHTYNRQSLKYVNRNAEDIDEHLVMLIDLNAYALSDQCFSQNRQELKKILANNNKAQNKLKYLIDNQLEAEFEHFDQLKAYLSKAEKKSYLNI